MFSWERKICANTFCGYCTSHWYSSMRGLMFSEQGPIRGPILSLFSCNGIVRNAENPKQLYLAISNYNNYIYCISIYSVIISRLSHTNIENFYTNSYFWEYIWKSRKLFHLPSTYCTKHYIISYIFPHIMRVLRILHFQISHKFKFFITFHFLKYIKIHSLVICHDITSKTLRTICIENLAKSRFRNLCR